MLKKIEYMGELSLWGLSVEDVEDTDLTGIKFIDGHLEIGNTALTSLQMFDDLESVGGDLIFEGNQDLCTSEIEALVDRLLDAGGIGGETVIENNKNCE